MAEANSPDQCKFSVKLCNILDVMGYSYTQIKNGQKMAQYMENYMNEYSRYGDFSWFIAGSKKEGLSYLELFGDLDVMYIFNKEMCFEMNDSALRSHVDGSTYLLQYENCPPGYAMVEVDEHSGDTYAIYYILSPKANKRYFSSERLNNWMSTSMPDGMNKQQETVHRGPLPTKLSLFQIKYYRDMIERLERTTWQEFNPTDSKNKHLLNHILALLEMIFGKPKPKNQKPQNESADELCEQHGVENIYNRKEQVEPCKTKAEKSVEIERQVYSNSFADRLRKYARTLSKLTSNADIADEESESNASSHTKDAKSFYRHVMAQMLESTSRNGPAQTAEFHSPMLAAKSQDMVLSIPALCTNYMHEWSTRRRYHNFPTVEQIERISKMEAHVVPVGCKESPDAGLQWRICFTLGEVELIQSLNGTQLKLYVLLKMLAKNVIKPECPGIITSYVMKNVVLWMAELKPRDHFMEENLENCLIEAVHFLRLCVRNDFLPNYMIHSRNLLQSRLSLQDRGILLNLLDTLLQERGTMVMRCDMVRHRLNCPYFSRLFKYAGKDTLVCTDLFRIFLKPASLYELTDIESVLAAFLISVERMIDQQTSVVKLQSIVLLKYINTWILGLPYKSPEQIEKRSKMRMKCGDLKKHLAKSVTNALRGVKNDRPFLSIVFPILDVSNVTDEQMDGILTEDFKDSLAKFMLEFIDKFGTLDNMRILNIFSNPNHTAATMSGAQRMGEIQAHRQRPYSDLDLD